MLDDRVPILELVPSKPMLALVSLVPTKLLQAKRKNTNYTTEQKMTNPEL